MNTIILAQGQGSRWFPRDPRLTRDLPQFKQLIPFEGEYLINRIIRQQVELDLGPVYVLGWPEMKEFISGAWFITSPDPGHTCVMGINAVRHLWDPEGTIILCGDVIFSKRAVGMIADWGRNKPTPWQWIGRVSGPNPVTGKAALELYGLMFTDDAEFMHHMNVLTQCGFTAPQGPGGRLWHLYSALAGFSYDYKYADHACLKNFSEPWDFTDDIDSPEEWLQFGQTLRIAVAGDGP